MRRILFYKNKWLDWIIRLLFTFNIIIPGVNYSYINYPLDTLILTAIAFWFYIYKLNTVAFLFLLLAAYFNYFHLGMPGCC